MIYVLRLQSDRYFLLRAEETKSDAHILFEAEILYDYPKEYLPEFVYAKHTEDSPIDLDKYVKHYMIWFGIDHVRGGSYLNINLPDYQQKTLLEEMNTAASSDDMSSLIEYANKPHTNEELRNRLAMIRDNYAKYKKDLDEKIDIDLHHIRKETNWLETYCKTINERITNTYLFKIENVANIERYRLLSRYLTKVRTIINDVLGLDINDPFVKYPQFVFDDFMYHRHRIHIARSMENMHSTIKQYNHLFNVIENRKAERDFDIASWGAHAERDMPREIYLLEKMLR
jgi:hypothetical protein